MDQYYAIKFIDLKDWCVEQLEIAGIPDGNFRREFIYGMFGRDSDEPRELFRYIQRRCGPVPEEER
jgi:hypothetical protein